MASFAKNAALVRHYIEALPRLNNFNRVPGNCRILSIQEGRVQVEMDVTSKQLNPAGTLHGGCTAALADIFTTIALLSMPRALPGVSVDLHCSYLSAAKKGETLIIDSQVIKSGRSMAFTRADFYKKIDGTTVATCLHTKALAPMKPQPEPTPDPDDDDELRYHGF